MFLLAAAVTWHLVLMPIPSNDAPMTSENVNLFKPFDTGRTFDSEDACRADGRARLSDYLKERGLPDGALANIGCTRQ